MKGNKELIKHLNIVLGDQLIAINQYFLHSRIFKNWGLDKLASKEYQHSICEMKLADDLMERILFLDGMPNLQDLGKLHIGEDTSEMLKCDMSIEHNAVSRLRTAIEYAESIQDYVSRDLLAKALDKEEEQVDWLETQLLLIGQLGIENYNQSQVGED
ncbi:bacterioferritin [Lacimicrobium alkaliphilum]|uniref:Bacterioferritin n=1 Tax=Lacimicrobium alkaliphilum TaxID=1526571 RepID=A0ABQ1R454_9ALTE|nr:bacterioferritin [Lacimicrobium alkaliphilum]GGD56580.1 bacterioferritin [Lacimicrobium alkaliphilum]